MNHDKIAWITGASTGIGRALALHMAADGWTVVASARSVDDLASATIEANEYRGRILSVPLDVTVRDDVLEAFRTIEDRVGPIDQVVLNAGTHKPIAAEKLKSQDVRSLMTLNVLGVTNCLEAILPRMVDRRRGRIAIVASIAGYGGLPTAAAYGASKAALINLAEAMRVELERFGIVVQVVNPGFVKTPLTDRNEFPMPFLMPVDTAADAFYRGLQSDRFEIAFPRRFAWLMKAINLLPYPFYFAITRRLVPARNRVET